MTQVNLAAPTPRPGRLAFSADFLYSLRVTPSFENPDLTKAAPPTPYDTDRIVLTGFMGSGKTTVGDLLSRELGWEFIDLDQEIERREQRTVPEIFAESGETYFRRLETIALVSMLGRRNMVLALGGGAPEALGNKLLLEQTPRTVVVHLAAPFTVLIERCMQQEEATERPLLANLDAAEMRFASRRKIYQRVADHSIDTSDLDALQTVREVLNRLITPTS